ncbi:hypothetical protein ACFE04_016762 [Oxalis oulophora]
MNTSCSSSSRNIKYPFTATQWQELEHQALIFKYMVSNIPIPPDLLFAIKRTCLDSSKLFPPRHQPPHIGWSCFQVGLGRKIDPEPGRCRRTDGKKWRCSKEAYPDSKYCERHMHRGKNRSRKPVELISTTTSTTTNSSSTNLNHPFLYSSRPSNGAGSGLTRDHHDNNVQLLLDSGSSNYANNNNNNSTDYRNRYVYGLREEVDEHAFFSEPSGSTMRSYPGSSMEDSHSWQLKPLTMSSSSVSKQSNNSVLQNDYSNYLQLQTFATDQQNQNYNNHRRVEDEEEPQKIVHRFFDEWPIKNRETWLDLEDKSSSTTRLSISVPSSTNEFPIFTSRTHHGKYN